MPIRPEMRHHYRDAWPEISRRIREERAGSRCEWCGRPDRVTVYVCEALQWIDPDTGNAYSGEDGRRVQQYSNPELLDDEYPPGWPPGRRVETVLTVAHLDQDPSNNADDNLAALCQRCHNRHDMPQRQANTRATRRSRRALADLFDHMEGEPQ